MKKISWFSVQNTDISGALWSSQGYTNAAVSTITSIQEKGVAVSFNDPEIPFHINFCQPYQYQLNNTYNVGYTPWESTKIPEGWHYNMNVCDEICFIFMIDIKSAMTKRMSKPRSNAAS